jgi:signal transduction histidine kinase
VISELRPSALEGRELINAIREYSQDCAMRNEIEINVIVEGGRRLPLNVEQTLFRIVQGALSNVVRHSKATEAGVHLTYDTTSVTLKVSDNGTGFDITQEYNGLGLRSIRERVEKINGSLKIESELDQGTTITIKCIQ